MREELESTILSLMVLQVEYLRQSRNPRSPPLRNFNTRVWSSLSQPGAILTHEEEVEGVEGVMESSRPAAEQSTSAVTHIENKTKPWDELTFAKARLGEGEYKKSWEEQIEMNHCPCWQQWEQILIMRRDWLHLLVPFVKCSNRRDFVHIQADCVADSKCETIDYIADDTPKNISLNKCPWILLQK